VARRAEDRREETEVIELAIAAATKDDIAAIDEIERHSFKSPWSRQTFEGELLREWARVDVARHAGRIIAFCNYWLVMPKGTDTEKRADGEVHILAIATHPDYRGKGVGSQVLAHVLEVAQSTGCSLATLEVRRSNTPAIAMYERAGFKTVHVRARYYQDDGEDALVMLRGVPPE
jgi:ribosomal-protein-alanine N-acetyltransferase